MAVLFLINQFRYKYASDFKEFLKNSSIFPFFRFSLISKLKYGGEMRILTIGFSEEFAKEFRKEISKIFNLYSLIALKDLYDATNLPTLGTMS